jgi:hypothetical protein
MALAQTPPPAPPASPPPASPAPPPGGGPVIELTPEDRAPPPPKPKPIIAVGAGHTPEKDPVYSLTEQRFRSAAESISQTSIGGYGEVQVTGLSTGPGPRVWAADVRRIVLFVAHSFTNTIRVYTELEVEDVRNAEIEQGYIDWKAFHDYLGFRAGLVLVPMGITNEVHEPPNFNGVARPTVETVVIPSTWREIAAGFFGNPIEPLHYELYAMVGLDPDGLASSGFANATTGGEQSKAKAWAVAGRVEYEPLLGMVLGASGYATDAGQNGNFFDKGGHETDLRLPVLGFSIDARMRRKGLEAKILFTEWAMPGSGKLMTAYTQGGKALVFADKTNPVPTVMRGAYVELGYDVLHPTGITHELVPFVRGEAYDTQAAVPAGFRGNPAYNIHEVTMGLSYRPIREVAVKTDYLLRYPATGIHETQISAGVGFMY